MQPIEERKEWDLTSSQNENVKKDVERLLSSFDELQDRKIEFYQTDLTVKTGHCIQTNVVYFSRQIPGQSAYCLAPEMVAEFFPGIYHL